MVVVRRVVAELEPAVRTLVLDREVTVSACGFGVPVVACGDAERGERSGDVCVVHSLEPEMIGDGPRAVWILVVDDPVTGPHRGVEVAQLTRLLVGPDEPSDHLTRVEDD